MKILLTTLTTPCSGLNAPHEVYGWLLQKRGSLRGRFSVYFVGRNVAKQCLPAVSLQRYETKEYCEETVSGYSVYGSARKAERSAEGESEEGEG